MKKINKKVLKVVERVIRNEIKRASGLSLIHISEPTRRS